MKINLSKCVVVSALSALTVGMFIPVAQANADLSDKMRTQAGECRSYRDIDCLKVCNAANVAVQKNDGNEQAAVALCNEAHGTAVAARAAKVAAPMVGYAWMPDVEGTIGVTKALRWGFKVNVPGRADWVEFCGEYAKISPLALQAAGASQRGLPVGTRVWLGKLQYSKQQVEIDGPRMCAAGEFKILN